MGQVLHTDLTIDDNIGLHLVALLISRWCRIYTYLGPGVDTEFYIYREE